MTLPVDPDTRTIQHDGYVCEVVGDNPISERARLDLLLAAERNRNREAVLEAADDIARNGVAYVCRGRGWPRVACRTVAEVVAALGGTT